MEVLNKFWRKGNVLDLEKRRKIKVNTSCGGYQRGKLNHGKNQIMVSKHSVREIEPWYEEGKATIKWRLEPHFDHSIWNFISELESLLEVLSQVN